MAADTTCNNLTMQDKGEADHKPRGSALRRVRHCQPDQEEQGMGNSQDLLRKTAVIAMTM
jgi:hypothetical protein